MSARRAFVLAASILAAAALVAPAQAEVLKFHASLDGKYGPEPTGSPASGKAKVRVDTATHRVSVDLDVTGVTIDDLWDKLVAAPIGPIHFHKYATAAGGDSVLALPLPLGPDYRATKRGLHVTMKDYDYVSGRCAVEVDAQLRRFRRGHEKRADRPQRPHRQVQSRRDQRPGRARLAQRRSPSIARLQLAVMSLIPKVKAVIAMANRMTPIATTQISRWVGYGCTVFAMCTGAGSRRICDGRSSTGCRRSSNA